MTEFSRSLKLRSAPDTHFNVANVLTRQGSRDEALRHYQQALTLRPDFAAADSALKRLLSSNPKAGTLKARVAMLAVGIFPESADAKSQRR